MKDLLMVYIEHVTTVMKVETDIINSIAASPIVNVETFKLRLLFLTVTSYPV